VGLLAGLSTGALIGGLFGFISTYWRGSQLISGVGINLFAFGFVAFMLINLGAPGFHSVPRDVQVKMISLGVGSLSPLVFVTVGLAIAVYWMLRRTQLGIRIRSVGENPAAADVAGINVNALRLATALAAGAFAGLAGAYLSVDWLGAVTKELTAGRGFIALATVVFSGLNPLLALFGGFVFGFFDGFATWVSTYPKIKDVIPWQFVAMAPYIVTLLVVAGAIGRVRFPAALGVPYRRE
jgi:simple sugar transport system permease protein